MADLYYPISKDDEKALVTLCEKLGGRLSILEIGCGYSTSVLNRFGEVDIVEINKDRVEEVKHRDAFIMDSLEFKPKRKYDLIFIDGCHLYTNIKFDIDNLYPAVRKGGILCGHDFDSFGWDDKYINIDYYNNKHNGVIKAVTEKFNNVQKFDNSSVWWVAK